MICCCSTTPACSLLQPALLLLAAALSIIQPQKDPALRPNAEQLFEHPFIAAAPSAAPPQLLLRVADLGQRRRPVVGRRGSEPGGDYAVRLIHMFECCF